MRTPRAKQHFELCNNDLQKGDAIAQSLAYCIYNYKNLQVSSYHCRHLGACIMGNPIHNSQCAPE